MIKKKSIRKFTKYAQATTKPGKRFSSIKRPLPVATEVKAVYVAIAPTTFSSGTPFSQQAFNGITQGTLTNQRVGNKVQALYAEMHLTFGANANTVPMFIRVMFAESISATVTAAEFPEPGMVPTQVVDNKYRLLYDRTFLVGPAGVYTASAPDRHSIMVKIPWRRLQHFIDGGGVVQDRQLHLVMTTDNITAAAAGTIKGSIKSVYCDP